jgi:opacity protein-like surface antigen
MKTTFALLCSLLSLVGCATIPQGTAPSASPLISEDGKPRQYQVLARAEGNAGHFTLFGFIPLGRSDIDAAIHDAVATYQGDNLINVRYYVNSAYYFIGTSTSITVQGDVIKYGAGSGGATSPSKPITFQRGAGMFHRFNVGSAVDGVGIEYMVNQPLSDHVFFGFGIGYKKYSKEEELSYTLFPGYTFTWKYKTEFDVLPIAINIGGSAKKGLGVPLNPYGSVGIAYMPIYDYGGSGKFKWNQVGFNANVGVDYEVAKGFALGIDYKYFKSFVDLERGSSFSSAIEGIKFSNLSLTLALYP